MCEQNNKLRLSLSDVEKPLNYFFNCIMQNEDRKGLPRLVFEDAEYSEVYSIRIEKSNLGYSVSGTLNGSIAYQLNGRFFSNVTVK